MSKRKLLLVVGAGASVDFGFPLGGDVGHLIRAEAQKWFPLADQPDRNIYEEIERLTQKYFALNVPNYRKHTPNFEGLLYAIFSLAAAFPAGVYTPAYCALINPIDLPDLKIRGKRERVDRFKLQNIGSVLVDGLLLKFREYCQSATSECGVQFQQLADFLIILQNEFEVAIVSLNYDNIVYRAIIGIETGFEIDSGQFEQDRILNRKSWPCMLHLHGSVHFDMRDRPHGDFHEIHWQPDINASMPSLVRTPVGDRLASPRRVYLFQPQQL